jgi:hypothetical protein
MKPKAAVLITTLNEEATIGQVIDKVPVRVLSDEGYDTPYMSLMETLKTQRSKKPVMTRTNVFGNRALTSVARMLFKEDTTDLCTAFWGYCGCLVDRMGLIAQGLEIEADMFIECARHSFRIGEIAIDYGKRADRPKLRSICDGLKIASFLPKRRMAPGGRRAP